LDNATLIRRILRRQDATAANELVTRYYDEIYRYVHRQSLAQPDPRQEAMDLTQEIFIAALRSLPGYDTKKSGFRTWLYHVSSSCVIDARRKFSSEQVQIDTIELTSDENIVLDFENRELATRVELYLRELPGVEQRILRLHLYGEQTFGQIAAALEMLESTVKTKYYRSIKQLKEELRDAF